ncbi:MAG TPA: hypothetical protein VGR07_12540 [Thermoanaerobaculia bacterium]|jgi:hypothetical protein|nr:hypothetical protein [Thermoanaerobaculia bacterium]
MLSWRCRRFRAQFSPAEPETGSAHRGRCAECHAYAAALERAAAVRLPLPERLRAELSRLPAVVAVGLASPAGIRLPLPQMPLPAALRFRLQGIARSAERERPPEWIRSPRYAIAASLLLTVLSAALLGNPAELAARTASFMGREVAPPLHALHATAASRYVEIRGGLDASVRDLHSRMSTLTQFAGRLLPARRKP